VITYHEMNPGNLDYKVIGDSQEIIDGGKLDALVSLVLHVWQWMVQFGFAAWLSYCPLRSAVLFVAWVDFFMVGKVQLVLVSLWSAIVCLAWLCYGQA